MRTLRRTICKKKKSVLNLEKNVTKMYGMLQTAFRPSCMNRTPPVFEWDNRVSDGRESVRDYEGCGRSKEVNTPKLIGQRDRVRVRVTTLRFLREFRKRFCRKKLPLFKSRQ